MLTNLSPESPKYFCKICDIKTNNKKDFNKHILTLKHKNNTNITFCEQNNPQNPILQKSTCNICNKEYNSRVGLWYHKKKCKTEPQQVEVKDQIDINSLDINLIMQILKQNDEFKALMIEQNDKLIEAYKNNTTNINNTVNQVNSHNKTFNLNVFLNEQCKDAMNIMEFVDSIKLDLDDADSVRKLGYVNGISNIIIKHLKALDVHMRPVHCTDLKRETMFVKYQDVWCKQDADCNLIRKAIKHVAVKNYNASETFKELHPDCMDLESKYNDQFLNMKIEALGGAGNNNIYESHTKIIKKIAKEVTIDKHA
jgi:hypothetical protein